MIKVLLVDDHELVRTCIEHMLNKTSGISVVGTAGSGEEAIEEVQRLAPDVVLMDLRMPGIGGLEASRKLYQKYENIRIIALSAHDDGPLPLHLMRIGAHGFISKSSQVDEMVRAIETAYRGKRYFSSDVVRRVLETAARDGEGSPFDQLSQREMEVVMLIFQAKSIPEMAKLLRINPKTVNTYRYRVHEKLGVKSDIELILLAVKHNLIKADEAN